MGYRPEQIDEMLGYGPEVKRFGKWMHGQTMAYCETHQSSVIYAWDYDRFIEGRPIID